MKICPVGAELFHADGRTDKTHRHRGRHDEANRPYSWYCHTRLKKFRNVITFIKTLRKDKIPYIFATIHSAIWCLPVFNQKHKHYSTDHKIPTISVALGPPVNAPSSYHLSNLLNYLLTYCMEQSPS